MKKTLLLFALMTAVFTSAFAKVWRINNTAGVAADFTSFNAAASSATVAAGDTLHLEPSIIQYGTGSFTLAKRLVVIGPGYFLDPANTGLPGNPGLQAATESAELAFFRLGAGSDGSKFMGVTIVGSIYFNGASNVTFEKVYFPAGVYFENGTNDATSFRKCFFNNGANISMSLTAVVTNFVCENNIFFNHAYATLNNLSGSGNIFRNNTLSGGNQFHMVNTYFANNICMLGNQVIFTNCTVKNNLFQIAQTLPASATNNQVNVNMANVVVGGTTGSLDSRCVLKAGSPAIGAGLTIGAVVNPDCGAFGATDPYKLSGIPNIPSIYALTVPVSIPAGSATMNVTFSTRNNN